MSAATIAATIASAGSSPRTTERVGTSVALGWALLGIAVLLFVTVSTLALTWLIRQRATNEDRADPRSDVSALLAANAVLTLTLLRAVAPDDLVELIDRTPKPGEDPLTRLLYMLGDPSEDELSRQVHVGSVVLALARVHALATCHAHDVKRMARRVKHLSESTVTDDRVTVRSAQITGAIITLLCAVAGCVFAGLKLLT
jgi:hypothetical protein